MATTNSMSGRGGAGTRVYGTVYPRRRKRSFRRFYGKDGDTTGTKGFRVSEGNLEYLKKVLERDSITYEVKEEDGVLIIYVPVSGNRFHEAVRDSFCIRQMETDGVLRSDGSGLPVPVYTFFSYDNKEKRKRLSKLYDTDEYVALKADEWRFEEAGVPVRG